MQPSLILLNGKIYTMDEKNPKAEAVAIYHNIIRSVGKDSQIEKLAGPNTKVVNLKGKTVIPGITDAHVHFTSYAITTKRVNLDGAVTINEALDRIKNRVMNARKGEWILGRGWDKNLWESGGFPRKEDLDKISPENPVALNCKDGHVMWVNSAALRTAGINKDTPQPEGGEIEIDAKSGEPTGILKELAQTRIREIIPEPTLEELTEATIEAIQQFQSVGITAITDSEGTIPLKIFQNLLAKNMLGLRVSMMFPIENLDAVIKYGIQSGFGNKMLKIMALKIVADGAIGSQTAAMLEGYENNPTNKGILRLSEKELDELVFKSTTNGIGVAVHCIGDRANRVVLDIIESNMNKVKSEDRVRYRIEHAQHLTGEDVVRFGKLGVIASMQPIHIALDMDIANQYIGERSRWAYPFRTLLDTGAILAFGSDAPVERFNPFLGIYTAVTRKRSPDYPKGGWYPQEKITVEEAVRAYTFGGAYAAGEEDVRGTITPAKLADIIVLSKNIFEIPLKQIIETEVEMTIFNGEVVYEKT